MAKKNALITTWCMTYTRYFPSLLVDPVMSISSKEGSCWSPGRLPSHILVEVVGAVSKMKEIPALKTHLFLDLSSYHVSRNLEFVYEIALEG